MPTRKRELQKRKEVHIFIYGTSSVILYSVKFRLGKILMIFLEICQYFFVKSLYQLYNFCSGYQSNRFIVCETANLMS